MRARLAWTMTGPYQTSPLAGRGAQLGSARLGCACSPLSGPTYGAPVQSSRHGGGRPSWSDCSRPSLRIRRRWHRGSIAWYPGPNPTRKPHEPCACSPLSGPTYGADVHSSCGGRPTWSDCSRPSLQIGRRWHRGSIAWYPGPNPTRKPHEPCACSPLSGPTYGADVHSSCGGSTHLQ